VSDKGNAGWEDTTELKPQATMIRCGTVDPRYNYFLSGSSDLDVTASNIAILERFHSKALRIIVDAPWYVPNNHIHRDLQMASVKEEICRSSNGYYARLTTHPNDQILTLMEIPGNRRLRRHVPSDLPDRFLL
jgi:hypothetical protein